MNPPSPCYWQAYFSRKCWEPYYTQNYCYTYNEIYIYFVRGLIRNYLWMFYTWFIRVYKINFLPRIINLNQGYRNRYNLINRPSGSYNFCGVYKVVYDRNHYFGLGPILKRKPKFNRNHILKGKSSYRYWKNLALVGGISSIMKESQYPNLLPNFKYF